MQCQSTWHHADGQPVLPQYVDHLPPGGVLFLVPFTSGLTRSTHIVALPTCQHPPHLLVGAVEVGHVLGHHPVGGDVGAAAKPPLAGDAVPLLRLKVPGRGGGEEEEGGGGLSGGGRGTQVAHRAVACTWALHQGGQPPWVDQCRVLGPSVYLQQLPPPPCAAAAGVPAGEGS